MLLSRREVFSPTEEQKIILGHMGYAAFKLWNVANYEKRNYKELGMSQYPNWYDQKKRLKENFFYKNLPSQTAQDVLQQLEEAWKSFFMLLKSKGVENPNPKQLKTYLKSQEVDANYLYLKTKRFSDIHIKEIQIKFDEKRYTAIAVYEEAEVPIQEDNGHYLAIDMGLKNTLTCYDSEGKTFLINGLLNTTHYFDKQIAGYQGISDRQQSCCGIKYPKKTKKVRSLYRKKKNKVSDLIHKTTRYVAEYCLAEHITTVVIGDMKGIRKENNLGRINQQLHSFPYEQIFQKLEYKLKRYGIRMIRQKESYSSQCSPKSDKVGKAFAQKHNRKYRGLYVDGTDIYNADCVGAYNILRLYLQKNKLPFPEAVGLNCPQKVFV